MIKETIRRISELQKANAQRAAAKREERQKICQTAIEEQRRELENQKREQKEMYREDVRTRFQFLKRARVKPKKDDINHRRPSIGERSEQVKIELLISPF